MEKWKVEFNVYNIIFVSWDILLVECVSVANTLQCSYKEKKLQKVFTDLTSHINPMSQRMDEPYQPDLIVREPYQPD